MERALAERPDEVLGAFDEAMFSPSEAARGALGDWQRTVGGDRGPVASLRAGLRYLARFRLDPSGFPVPVALLHGEADAICPVGGARRLVGGLANGTLDVWPDVGHAPFVAQPDRFAAWLAAVAER
jgi:pimeloyl-ACP methyl ester carboxylesterase